MMNQWTIQLLIDCDIVVSARCLLSCDSQQELDLVRLKAELGPEASAMYRDLAPRMRCSKCSSDKIALSYSPRHKRTAESKMAGRYDPLNLLRPADAKLAPPSVGNLGQREGVEVSSHS